MLVDYSPFPLEENRKSTQGREHPSSVASNSSVEGLTMTQGVACKALLPSKIRRQC